MKKILDLINDLSKRDTKTLSQKALKLQEECGELAKAVLPYESASGCNHRFPDMDKITEECADVMLVAYSIALSQGVSPEDIFKTVGRKAVYWQRLIEAEEAIDLENLMFEIHITVDKASSVEQFIKDCESLKVKPIILDLYTGGEVIKDVMTSSTVKGTTVEAATAARALTARLRALGYKVVREKIETVPWHPASKVAHLNPSPERYFEAHLAFAINDDPKFKEFAKSNKIHLSRNTMKSGKQSVIMGTYRRSSHETTSEKFEFELSSLVQQAKDLGFEITKKPITEYALHDSNNTHDEKWTQ